MSYKEKKKVSRLRQLITLSSVTDWKRIEPFVASL